MTPTMNRKNGKIRSVGVQPFHVGVLERRIDRAPRAGVVHEQHSGDGQAAEDVERQQPFARRFAVVSAALGGGSTSA